MSSLAERLASHPDMPFGVRKCFATAGEPTGWTRNWTLLWREVVARAVMDALGFTGHVAEPDKHLNAMIDAQRWFRYSREDISQVFELADLPLEICRESVISNLPLTHVPKSDKTVPSKKGAADVNKNRSD